MCNPMIPMYSVSVSFYATLSLAPTLLFFFFNETATTEIYPLSYTTLFRSEVVEGVLRLAAPNLDATHRQERVDVLRGAGQHARVGPRPEARRQIRRAHV